MAVRENGACRDSRMEEREGRRGIRPHGADEDATVAMLDMQNHEDDHDIPDRTKLIKTACAFGAFIGYGLTTASFGPALMDLQTITGSNIVSIATVLTFKRAGGLVGSLAGGLAYDKLDHLLPIMFSTLLIGCTSIAIPWCPSLVLMVVVATMQGLANGVLETCCNVLVLQTWRKDCKPYYQALHFTFALGAFLSPLVMEPFIGQHQSPGIRNQNHNRTARLHASLNITSLEALAAHGSVLMDAPIIGQLNSAEYRQSTTAEYAPPKTKEFIQSKTSTAKNHLVGERPRIYIPFAIFGAFAIVIAIPLAILRLQEALSKSNAKDGSMAKKNIDKTEEEKPTEVSKEDGTILRVLAIGGASMFCFCDLATQDVFSGLVATFSVLFLDWSAKEGSLVTSIYWGSYGVGRLLAVPVSKFVMPMKMLGALLVILLGSAIALVSGITASHIVLWVCAGTLGLAQGPLQPTNTLCLDRYVQVIGRIASLLLLLGSLGGMSMPPIVGYFFKQKQAMALPYYMVAAITTMWLIYFIKLTVYSRFRNIRH